MAVSYDKKLIQTIMMQQYDVHTKGRLLPLPSFASFQFYRQFNVLIIMVYFIMSIEVKRITEQFQILAYPHYPISKVPLK